MIDYLRERSNELRSDNRCFPISAGVLFGLGLGGFFDGIVQHQLLHPTAWKT